MMQGFFPEITPKSAGHNLPVINSKVTNYPLPCLMKSARAALPALVPPRGAGPPPSAPTAKLPPDTPKMPRICPWGSFKGDKGKNPLPGSGGKFRGITGVFGGAPWAVNCLRLRDGYLTTQKQHVPLPSFALFNRVQQAGFSAADRIAKSVCRFFPWL
jgi:hypothetical protein